MTAVGTPLFAAPELSRGEAYDEKVDIYSFGVTLLDMAVEDELSAFIGERWRMAFGEEKVPSPTSIAFNRVLRPIWEDGWRPVDPADASSLPWAPPTVVILIDQCCHHDPAARPSFDDILRVLTGACTHEIEGNFFGRSAEFRPRSTLTRPGDSLLSGASSSFAANPMLKTSEGRRSLTCVLKSSDSMLAAEDKEDWVPRPAAGSVVEDGQFHIRKSAMDV